MFKKPKKARVAKKMGRRARREGFKSGWKSTNWRGKPKKK